MEERRFQVFVSSTFEDLREERQAAVEAILKAGHIPAGMELFTAGNQSQMEVIRQWIKDSDIYMLILGGRYGSIEPTSGLSYTEIEYRYAIELGKPFFAVVIKPRETERRVRQKGSKVLELQNTSKYDAFRLDVCSRMCSFFESTKDVKLAVFETLPHLAKTPGLVGWVSGANAGSNTSAAIEVVEAVRESRKLAAEVEKLKGELQIARGDSLPFADLELLLRKEKVSIPEDVYPLWDAREYSLLDLMVFFSESLVTGINNSKANEGNAEERFKFFYVARKLATYGLTEPGAVPPNVQWVRLKISKQGIGFLSYLRSKVAADERTKLRPAEPKDRKPSRGRVSKAKAKKPAK